jgi:type VI secretion system secreted protein VgrG
MGQSCEGKTMDAYREKRLGIDLGTHSARAVIRVASLHGREAISDLYRFDVHIVAADEGDGFEAAVLSAPATLMLESTAGLRRSVYGIVAGAELEGQLNHGWHGYRLRVVPKLWLLKRRKNSRVFQDLTVVDIVTALLQEHSVAYRWRVQGPYLPRAYCVQYQETDYAFVTRLLASEGLFFSFDHPANPGGDDNRTYMGTSEVLVLSDTAAYYPKLDQGDQLSACHDTGPGMVPRDDQVFGFRARRRIKSRAALVRGYDFRRPTLDLGDARVAPDAQLRPEEKGMPAERHPVAPEDAAQLAALHVMMSVRYEHEGSYEAPPVDPGPAVVRLEQERARVETAEGNSLCRWLIPGQTFTLHDHFSSALNQAYVVTSIEHHAYAAEVLPAGRQLYSNRFECAPAVVRFRPRARAKHLQQALESAVVVGPKGEEIHTDEFGRIKVQFPWDREGKRDDRSSCWLRVMQAWGGAGWGAQFIPRVGMEVMVSFVGGDVDAPVVAGCVYNATHPVPFKLPAEKTRSGIRTQTTPGGGGSNELSFDDGKGQEQLYVHAQRDLDEVVERNHTLLVRSDERLSVLGSRVDIVEGDSVARVVGLREEHVAGDHTAQVDGNRIDVVTGDSDERVSGTLTTRLEGKERRDVQQNADLEYAEDLTTRVRGCMTTLVGKSDKKRSWVTHAEGVAALSSLDSTEVLSEGEIVLRVGKSSIRITSDRIELDAPAVTVKGKGGGLSADDDGLRLASKGDVQVLVDKKLVIKTKDGASLSMQKEVKIDGAKILLNSPEQANDLPPKDPDPPTKVELKDDDGKPLAYQRFRLVLDDGSEVSGTTDKDGNTEMDLKSAGRVTFPDLGKARPA